MAELAALGANDHEIGRKLGVSKTTISADRRVLGIAPHPPGQPAKSPQPDERPCETCGRMFRPRRHNVAQGGGRFCSGECMSQDGVRRGASRRFVSRLNASRAETILVLKAEGDLLTRDDVAAELCITPSNVDHYLRHGYLAAVAVEETPGQRVRLVRRGDVERFKREWRPSAAGRQRLLRAHWLNPAWVVHVYRARGILERRAHEHGLSEEQMAAVVRHDVEERARRFASRGGRPKGSGPPARHYEWAEAFLFWKETMQEDFEWHRDYRLLGPGERPPTDADAFLAVAEADFREHPERWNGYQHAPGDPGALHPKWAKPAIARVRNAVNRLQIAETKTS